MLSSKGNKEFKILIVDDVPKNIQVLGNILINKDYQISYTQDGHHAISLLKKIKFDLILLDIMMPEIDGYEVCRKIMADPETADIPIIFLSAKADKDSVIKGFKLGARDYVTKPFNAEELLARVKTHLDLKDKTEQLSEMNHSLEDKVRKRTKELKAANKELLKLDNAKNDFLNIISHELRTPLNGIQGLTTLLTDSTEKKEQLSYIDNILEASDRLVRFSEKALLITSLNSGKYIMKKSDIKLNDFLIECFESKLKNTKKKFKFNIEIIPENLTINADSYLLKDCFESIIDNSIKYSGDNCEISFTAKSKNNQILINFSDNGKGFSDIAKDSLFNYFYSEDVMHTEGLGLGLASVKLIMENHNGSIEISNNDNGGANVDLIFVD